MTELVGLHPNLDFYTVYKIQHCNDCGSYYYEAKQHTDDYDGIETDGIEIRTDIPKLEFGKRHIIRKTDNVRHVRITEFFQEVKQLLMFTITNP